MVRRSMVAMLIAQSLVFGACGTAAPAPAADAEVAARRMSATDATSRVLDALLALPEVQDLKRRIEANGNQLVVMLEGDADPAVDHPRSWQVYVGESTPDHLARLWAFTVDAETGAMTITDPVTLEDQSFEEWRRALAASPP